MVNGRDVLEEDTGTPQGKISGLPGKADENREQS
jgi:hypothetical protein